jgi:hypothetical protein
MVLASEERKLDETYLKKFLKENDAPIDKGTVPSVWA